MASAEQLRVCFEVLQLYRALGSCMGSHAHVQDV